MLLIANKGKRVKILKKIGKYFSLLKKSLALQFRENHDSHCFVYKFLEVAVFSYK